MLQVCGAIGPLVSLDQKSASVAETEIGVGNTTAWKLCVTPYKPDWNSCFCKDPIETLLQPFCNLNVPW